jgi:hypothetical protein
MTGAERAITADKPHTGYEVHTVYRVTGCR